MTTLITNDSERELITWLGGQGWTFRVADEREAIVVRAEAYRAEGPVSVAGSGRTAQEALRSLLAGISRHSLRAFAA